jgi:hypothetical protein
MPHYSTTSAPNGYAPRPIRAASATTRRRRSPGRRRPSMLPAHVPSSACRSSTSRRPAAWPAGRCDRCAR